LIDDDFSVVFYGLTTIRSEALSLRGWCEALQHVQTGFGRPAASLSGVQTADGMPICHEVFDGNTTEAPTMLPTVRKAWQRYPHIRRLVMVAHRGSLSINSLTDLAAIPLPSGQPLEFILAVPSRRYGEFVEMLQLLPDAAALDGGETITQVRKDGHRLTVARDPARAQMMHGKLVVVKNGRPQTRRDRATIREPDRHRARFQSAQVRDRCRADLPPVARADSSPRQHFLHGLDLVLRDAPAPQDGRPRCIAGDGPGATAVDSGPECAHQPRLGRHVGLTEHPKL